MMEKKQFIKPLVTIAVIAIIVGVYLFFNWEEITMRDDYMTIDDYISLVNNNKDDFEYVAKTMMQWSRCGIYFDDSGRNALPEIIYFDDYLSSNNQEIIDELTNDQEFYNHVMNIYNMNEFRSINNGSESIYLGVTNPPEGFHGAVKYYKNSADVNPTLPELTMIDEHWGVLIIGNI